VGRYVACMGEMRNEYKILVRKSKGRRPLGRPKHRWDDNVRMDQKQDVRARTESTWLAIRFSGRFLWT
jgi:hypothetical protein